MRDLPSVTCGVGNFSRPVRATGAGMEERLGGKSPCSKSISPVCTSPKIAEIRLCRVV
jgi:hypothetical protein